MHVKKIVTTNHNSVISNLDAFIKKYYRNKLIKGLICVAALLLSLFLFFVFIEYFGYLSSPLRAILFWLFIAVAVVVSAFYIVLPLVKMYRIGKCITYEQAAVIIGQFFPEVKDKLLNLLQLQSMSATTDSDLLLASIRQKTDLLSPIPFSNAINISDNKRYLRYILAPLAIIILLLIFIPSFVAGPSNRIIHYNTYYEKPAPFSFVLLNDTLLAEQYSDFVVNVEIQGSSLPAESFLLIDGKEYRMHMVDKSHFSYTFKQLQRSTEFQFKAADVVSKIYALSVLPKPQVVDFQVSLSYPAYTRQASQTLSNQGDFSVSQGTLVRWTFLTSNVDSLCFSINGTPKYYAADKNGRFAVSLNALNSVSYDFSVLNSHSVSSDTLHYTVSVVPDIAPLIAVAESFDSSLPDRRFFRGRIKDDYGFSKLQFVIVKTNATDTSKHQRSTYPVALTAELAQEFLYSLNIAELALQPGDQLSYYFIVWDNDAIHGPKSATSQHFQYDVPTNEQLDDILSQNITQAEEAAQSSVSHLKQLQEEIGEVMQRLVDKKELSWQDKQQLQELVKKQKQVLDELKQMQQQLQQNNALEEKYREQNEQILQKQEELNKLFNEVMTDEMKQMMSEIEKLMQETDKKKVQDQLENIKLSNDDLEKQIDQDMELLKHLEMEKKVQEAVNKADELAKKQEELSQQSAAANDKESDKLKQQQQNLNKEYQQLKEDIKQIQQEYKQLDKSIDFKVSDSLQRSVDNHQQQAEQKLGKGKNKEASKQQKSAADDMKELSEQMAAEQMRLEQEDLAEDSEMIRRLLKSLVTLSFNQEELIGQTNKIHIQNPKYQQIIVSQNKIKSDFRNINDSLSAIAKRQVTVASAITREVGNINTNVAKSLSSLLYYNQAFYGNAVNGGASASMQYAMTSFNNLALVLAESLDQMQSQMRQNSQQQKQGSCKRKCNQKQGNCKNPGSGKPSPKSIKQMQEELNKQMEALKKQLDKQGNQKGSGRKKIGQGDNMSEEFAKMAAKQEMIRRMMQEYGQEMKQQDAGNGKLSREIDELLRQMEQTETDLVNRTISQQTIMRQQQIMTRLLEHEKADMQREKEDRRQSHEAVEQLQSSPSGLQDFDKLRRTNSELFHTTPPSLTPYYKSKVSSYFYGF